MVGAAWTREMTSVELANLLLEYARNSQRAESDAECERALSDAWLQITRWAAGRVPVEVVGRLTPEHDKESVRDAALLFLREVCFSSGATFYEMFGLRADTFSPQLLRTRYRVLIRLTHPDVGVEGLPAGAASAVNHAYSVLNNDSLRLRYDELREDKHRQAWRTTATGAAENTTGYRGASEAVWPEPRWQPTATAWRGRALGRWARVSMRWRRELPTAAVMLVAAATLWLLIWYVGHRTDANVIVASGSGNSGELLDSDAFPAAAPWPLADGARLVSHGVRDGGSKAHDQSAEARSTLGGAEPDHWSNDPSARAIDEQAARRYVEGLALMVDDVEAGAQFDSDLEQAGVRGTLLRPVLDLYRLYDQLVAEQLGWSTTAGDGRLTAKAIWVIQASSGGAWSDAYLYRVEATFHGMEDGAMLSMLDFFPMR